MRCNTRTNWEFYAVLDGRCGLRFADNQPRVLYEHMLWVFAPECAHAWSDDGRVPYHRLAIHFGSVPYPLDEIVRQHGGWLRRPLSASDITRLLEIAAPLERHFCQPVIASPLHFQRGLADLALLLLEAQSEAEAPLALTEASSFRVERAISWFTEHLARNPSVKEVAEAIHVSPSHLRRLCLEVRQASPKDLFRRIRLDHAQELMARTNLPLDEIADRCGYVGASHFCRDFKAARGFTPSTWRHRLIDRFTQPLPAGSGIPIRQFSARPGERSLRA